MCICIFVFKIVNICFFIVGKILHLPKLCNYKHKFLQYLTKMLSTINLLSDQPGTTRICSGKYGMQGNNKIKLLLIIAVTPFGHSGEIFLNAER